MSITHDQALALYAALLDSKPFRYHMEAVLGFARSPAKVTDFESNNSDTLDRCKDLLEHVTECTELLKTQLRDRPRQQSFEFPEGEEPPPRKAGKTRGRKKK